MEVLYFTRKWSCTVLTGLTQTGSRRKSCIVLDICSSERFSRYLNVSDYSIYRTCIKGLDKLRSFRRFIIFTNRKESIGARNIEIEEYPSMGLKAPITIGFLTFGVLPQASACSGIIKLPSESEFLSRWETVYWEVSYIINKIYWLILCCQLSLLRVPSSAIIFWLTCYS